MINPMNSPAPPLVVKPELDSVRHLMLLLADSEKAKARIEELTVATDNLKKATAAHATSLAALSVARADHEQKLRDSRVAHDRAIEADRAKLRQEFDAREQELQKKDAHVAELRRRLDAHLAHLSQVNRGMAAA